MACSCSRQADQTLVQKNILCAYDVLTEYTAPDMQCACDISHGRPQARQAGMLSPRCAPQWLTHLQVGKSCGTHHARLKMQPANCILTQATSAACTMGCDTAAALPPA